MAAPNSIKTKIKRGALCYIFPFFFMTPFSLGCGGGKKTPDKSASDTNSGIIYAGGPRSAQPRPKNPDLKTEPRKKKKEKEKAEPFFQALNKAAKEAAGTENKSSTSGSSEYTEVTEETQAKTSPPTTKLSSGSKSKRRASEKVETTEDELVYSSFWSLQEDSLYDQELAHNPVFGLRHLHDDANDREFLLPFPEETFPIKLSLGGGMSTYRKDIEQVVRQLNLIAQNEPLLEDLAPLFVLSPKVINSVNSATADGINSVTLKAIDIGAFKPVVHNFSPRVPNQIPELDVVLDSTYLDPIVEAQKSEVVAGLIWKTLLMGLGLRLNCAEGKYESRLKFPFVPGREMGFIHQPAKPLKHRLDYDALALRYLYGQPQDKLSDYHDDIRFKTCS